MRSAAARADGAALRQRFSDTTRARDLRTFRASSIVAGAPQDVAGTDLLARKAALKQSIETSANFLQNTPTVARGSSVHPLVQEAFVEEEVAAALSTGPQRAGLTRGETALLRLLTREADT